MAKILGLYSPLAARILLVGEFSRWRSLLLLFFHPGFSLYCIDVWMLMHSVWIGCSVLDRRELTCESVCDGACSSRPSWETAGRMLKSSGTLGCGLPRLVLLLTFGALTKLRSAASFLPYTSQVALVDY